MPFLKADSSFPLSLNHTCLPSTRREQEWEKLEPIKTKEEPKRQTTPKAAMATSELPTAGQWAWGQGYTYITLHTQPSGEKRATLRFHDI